MTNNGNHFQAPYCSKSEKNGAPSKNWTEINRKLQRDKVKKLKRLQVSTVPPDFAPFLFKFGENS